MHTTPTSVGFGGMFLHAHPPGGDGVDSRWYMVSLATMAKGGMRDLPRKGVAQQRML
jgi:hypothetical protein